MKEINIGTWINSFVNGEYSNNDTETQIKAGWYDWFCKSTSLRNKTYRMGSIIKQIKVGGKVDLDSWYVWFKNNCPMVGPLFDDFRFADIDTGNVQMTIQIDSPWSEHKYAVYGRTPSGKEYWDDPMFACDSSRELVKRLNKKWDE